MNPDFTFDFNLMTDPPWRSEFLAALWDEVFVGPDVDHRRRARHVPHPHEAWRRARDDPGVAVEIQLGEKSGTAVP